MTIPKEKITVITGVSGSGKSSLAFDTIYEESQRQFMDLVSANPLRGTDLNETMVDRITGLQPSIAIEQRSLGLNPRSTVGTVTKVGDFMKLLFAALGQRLCPNCHEPVDESHVCQKCGMILFDMTPQMFSYNHPDYMCPVCKGLGVEIQIDENLMVEKPELSLLDGASSWWGDLRKHRRKPNANWMRGEILALAEDMQVDLELPFNQLPEDFRRQIFHGSDGRKVSLQYQNANGRSGTITRPVEGAVNALKRFMKDTRSERGMDYASRYMTKRSCSRCGGERLLEEGRLVNIKGYRYPEVMQMNISDLLGWCHYIYSKMDNTEREKSRALLSKIIYRLHKVEKVGLGYLSPDRSIPSLSGGEAQRIKIATQFGSGLTNILYIMDEPSRGLHPKDYSFLLETICDLKAFKNTVIMVEHKKRFLSIADRHIEMGPRAGRYGGEIITVEKLESRICEETTPGITAADKMDIASYKTLPILLKEDDRTMMLTGVSTNNLKGVDCIIPMGRMTGVIGVSGSGKSSLISQTLYPA